MKTWQLNITGIVQGVGFRPHLFLLAKKFGFSIHVFNNGIGVKVLFNATDENAEKIVKIILSDIPKKAKIDDYQFMEIDEVVISENKIFQEPSEEVTAMITPDMAWCETCKAEYRDAKSNRHQFPFIACSDCGSRFSIFQKMPFERENTTMHPFAMCTSCKAEYDDFENNRRAFSQLISCPTCNFQSTLHTFDSTSTKEQLVEIALQIKLGEIVAIKGIAGFLFVLDYKNTEAILALRNLKNRPSKPFAIMAKDVNWVEEHFEISTKEKEEIISGAAPILLLQPKQNFVSTTSMAALCGPSQKVGVMIASSAFLYEICSLSHGAIVATSGNISGFPIEFQNESALTHLTKYTKHIWHYEREIIFPQDDSVMIFTPIFNKRIILRRGRGLSPSEYHLPKFNIGKTILALGAEMKSTFALGHSSQLLVSQYLGKLNNLESLERFEMVMQSMLQLNQSKPNVVLVDQHPEFTYRKLLNENPIFKNIKTVEIQHHVAHLAAVMGENELFNSDEKLLGIVFDGTGYSRENKILGGEFFVVENNAITQKYQMPFFRNVMRDEMAVQPRLCYYSICNGNISDSFSRNYSDAEKHNFPKILHQQIETNSMGRVFDALAFCFGYPEIKQSFEGETALFLHSFFEKGLIELGVDFNENYLEGNKIDWENVFEKIVKDAENEVPKNTIAIKFLLTIVHFSIHLAKENKIQKMAVSGGVFQNPVFVDLLQYHCNLNKMKLYLHQHFSPNDENISFGQMMAYLHLEINNNILKNK